MRARTILVTLVCGLALASCGNDQAAAPAASSTPAATTALPSTTAPSATRPSAPPRTMPATTTPRVPAASCGAETARWGTDDRSGGPMSRDALYLVRAGRHACYDRVVFALNGSAAVGFAIRYAPVVITDPKGDRLPVPGGATLELIVRAPALGSDDAGHQPGRVLAATGDYVVPAAQVAGWPSLRGVRFGGSFEGETTFAVGVRAKVPFRLFTQFGADRIRRVVVDIAH
ncbi:hypothetical protein ACGFMK_30370 [Amycolatopsis sp. NPDC049252]|uniref:AMIN-like domain-containing (lipo)protein n=1 Tax=Amycolatopsis sp. NPDC049252 TaxID=3363933 RepID=UPI0037239B48